jgi:hypothetical protein
MNTMSVHDLYSNEDFLAFVGHETIVLVMFKQVAMGNQRVH